MNNPEHGPEESSRRSDPSFPAASARRRALLVALPSIVSLHPGVAAAQARSSIALDWVEDGLCAAPPPGADETATGWQFEQKPSEVQFVSQEFKYSSTPDEFNQVTPKQMCEGGGGGTYYLQDPEGTSFEANKQIVVPQGSHMVSFMSASNSFTLTAIVPTDIL
ncbi:MAG TPA: hypothetical protein VGE10_05550 [Zeimonas sp.]